MAYAFVAHKTADGECVMTSGVAQAIKEGRDELTPDEAAEYVADRVRCELGISLDEFLQKAEAGTLPESPAIAHLILLTGATATTC